METDTLTDELFLQHVLERQPATAPRGKKRRVWFEIAKAINDASGRVVLASGESAIQRLRVLTTVFKNEHHALHGELTREMRTMLQQINGAAPPSAARPSTRTQTRTRPLEAGDVSRLKEDPARKRRAVSQDRVARGPHAAAETTRSDGGDEQGASETALVPYDLPNPARLSTQEALDRYLGAQTERDLQSRHERELLRREISECKRDTAVLERQLALLQTGALGPHRAQGEATTEEPSVQRILLELMTQQRLTLDEMRAQRVDTREQIAAMMEAMMAALRGNARAREDREVMSPSSV